jgi:hypothetical protein
MGRKARLGNGTPFPDGPPVWMEFARCSGTAVDFFDPKQYQEARNICASCPVLEECKAHGLAHEQYGVWGGLSPEQRRKLRKEAE